MPFKIDELYYELDARTAGFENRILHAQTSVDNFAKFIREKPMLATAALGASIIAVGVAAVKMASDVDTSLRKVQAAFPGATGEINKLRNAIALLSTESPRSQKELSDAAAEIAAKGVSSVDELIARLRTTTTVADATGESLDTVSEGLDNIADAFRLTTRQASDALTVIFGYTQGKVALADVFQTLQRGGAVLADLGVKAEDAGQAMAALIDAGVNRRQVGVVLTNVLELTNRVRELRRGTEDQATAADIIDKTLSRSNIAQKGFITALGQLATGLEKAGVDTRELGIRTNTLSAITRVAEAAAKDHRTEAEKLADAHERLAKAAETNRTSAHALSQLLLNELSESFIRLGNKILPGVISLLEKTADLMARIRGEGNPLKDLTTLQGAVPTGRLPENTGFSSEAFRRGTRFETDDEKKARAFMDAFVGAGVRAQRYGAEAFSGLTSAQIQTIIDNVRKFVDAHPDLAQTAVVGSDRKNQLNALQQQLVNALGLAISGESAGAGGGTGTGGTGGTSTAPLEKATRDAIRAMRQSVKDTLANATTTQIDDATAMVQKFRDEVDALEKQARQKLPDLRAEVDRLAGEAARVEAKERSDAARQVADEVAKALGVQSVAMQQSLDDFNAEVAKRNAEYAKLGKAPLFTDDQIAQVRAVREALISATQAAEQTDAVLTRIRAEEASRPQLTPSSSRTERLGEMGVNVASMIEVEQELAKRRADLAALGNNQDAASQAKRKALLEQIATLQGKINDLQGRNRTISDAINASLLKRIALLQQQASAIGEAANLAAQLVSAFGDTGQQIGNIITQLGQVGQAVKQFSAFKEAFNVFKSGAKDDQGNPLMTLGGLIGQAQPIIGGITAAVGLLGGLFGKSPEQQRREQLQRENNDQLRALNKNIGDLGRINVTGTQLGTLQRFFAQPALAQAAKLSLGGVNADTINRIIGTALDAVGLSAKEFKDIMRSFGLSIDDAAKITVADVDALKKAIKASELTQFADTFEGQMSQFQAAVNVFDLQKPIDQFHQLQKSIAGISGGGGALQQLLNTFDLTSPEGVQAAIEQLQNLFNQLQTLTPDQMAGFLGGLTPEQFQQLLEQAIGIVRAQGAPGGPLGTGGFSVDRTITEVTGTRMAALILSGNAFAERTANATEAIARALGAAVGPFPGISPPTISGTSAGGGDFTFNITVEVNGPISGDPETVGRGIGSGIAQKVNSELGRDARIKNLQKGLTLRV